MTNHYITIWGFEPTVDFFGPADLVQTNLGQVLGWLKPPTSGRLPFSVITSPKKVESRWLKPPTRKWCSHFQIPSHRPGEFPWAPPPKSRVSTCSPGRPFGLGPKVRFRNLPNAWGTWGGLKWINLGGGLKYFLCSPLFGKDSHLTNIFQYFFKGLKPPSS